MPTTYHTSLMTTDAEVNKYFHSPAGTLATPAVVGRVTFDSTSCIRIPFGTEVPTVVFAGGGGGTAYADMVAAVGSYAAGAVAYCFAINSAEFGRYVRTAGVWVKTGLMAPLYDYDNNHMKVINDLLLLLQTGFATGHPLLASDGGGPFVDKVAYPNATDLTNHIMRLTMRAVNLAFPSDFKVGMHLQGELDSHPRIGTGNAGAGAFPLVNAMNHTDILGKLGAGNAGIYADNTVNYICDSGWVEVDIPFSPSDAMWTMMLGMENKDGNERAAYNQPLMYVGTSAKRLVGADVLKINAYLCGFRWNPNPGVAGSNTTRPRTSPAFEPTGDLYVSKIEFISP